MPRVAHLLDKRLLVVTGKGGVGKTTVAAALGLVAARGGRRVVVAEVARRSDVTSVLDAVAGAGATSAERELAPGLFHVSVDPQEALEEYLRDQLPRGVSDTLTRSRMFGYLAAATPGLRELLTVGKLWELAQPDRRTPGATAYDLVVVDAPATGHGIGVLRAPRTFAQTAAGGPVARQAGRIDATLSDPALTAVVAVTRAEELPVSETLTLRDALRAEMGLELHAIVANALEPDRFTPREATRLAEHAEAPAVALALRAHARARRQRGQLGRLRRATGMRPLHLPRHAGRPDLGTLATELAAALREMPFRPVPDR
jgi:anion-transporting  ArsA/GET3 family ATPase